MSIISNISNIIYRKNNNNIIKLILGKNNFNNFLFKIDLRKFEDILSKIKKYNSHFNVTYKNYNKYYDIDKIYIIDDNGNENYYKYNNINTQIFSLNIVDIQIEIISYEILGKEAFELKYKYDKTINIQSICFDYKDFLIEFTKNIDEEVYYKITIIINNKNANINDILSLL